MPYSFVADIFHATKFL